MFWTRPRDFKRLGPISLKTNFKLIVMFWRPGGNSRLGLPPIVQSVQPVRLGSSDFTLSLLLFTATVKQHNILYFSLRTHMKIYCIPA